MKRYLSALFLISLAVGSQLQAGPTERKPNDPLLMQLQEENRFDRKFNNFLFNAHLATTLISSYATYDFGRMLIKTPRPVISSPQFKKEALRYTARVLPLSTVTVLCGYTALQSYSGLNSIYGDGLQSKVEKKKLEKIRKKIEKEQEKQ